MRKTLFLSLKLTLSLSSLSQVEARAGFQPQFELMWYPARYDRTLLGVREPVSFFCFF